MQFGTAPVGAACWRSDAGPLPGAREPAQLKLDGNVAGDVCPSDDVHSPAGLGHPVHCLVRHACDKYISVHCLVGLTLRSICAPYSGVVGACARDSVVVARPSGGGGGGGGQRTAPRFGFSTFTGGGGGPVRCIPSNQGGDQHSGALILGIFCPMGHPSCVLLCAFRCQAPRSSLHVLRVCRPGLGYLLLLGVDCAR